MAAGDITAQEWADWLGALALIHAALDVHLPACLHRQRELMLDRLATDAISRPSRAALDFAFTLDTETAVMGAAYIFFGAHLRGGAVIRKRLEPKGFPCAHLRFDQAREADEAVKALRDDLSLAPGAVAAFEAILAIMDEIGERA
jgi:heme oxygenase